MLASSSAGFSISFGLLVAIIGPLFAAVALAFAISRTQALSAWRSAAEGYKEQVTEMTQRLTNAEQKAIALHAEVTRMAALPDLTQVDDKLDTVIGIGTRIEGAVNDLGTRWG